MKLNLGSALVAMFLLFPAVSFGGGVTMVANGPSTADVNSVREKAADFLAALAGANGSAITACETKTGEQFTELSQAEIEATEFEYCLMLMASTESAASALKTLIPVGTRIGGVYVTSMYVGVLRPQ